MSLIKRYLGEVAEAMGIDDIMDDRVHARANMLMKLRDSCLPHEKEAQFWVSYDVGTNGQVNFMRNYVPGHSIKCKWTAFLNDLSAHSTPGTWRVVEDTAVRKAVAYTDRYIKMTVFQLIVLNVLNDPPPAEYSESEYKSLGQCIQDGTHLTDCDDDGYCNYCGEQDPPSEKAPVEVRCAACGTLRDPASLRPSGTLVHPVAASVPMKDGYCYN